MKRKEKRLSLSGFSTGNVEVLSKGGISIIMAGTGGDDSVDIVTPPPPPPPFDD